MSAQREHHTVFSQFRRIRNAYHGRTRGSAPTAGRDDVRELPDMLRCPIALLGGKPNGDTETLVCALPWYLTVGADPCVRPAGTSYGFLPFSANSQCLPRADTQVRPYGGKGRCSGITRHVMLSDCPVRRQTQWRHRNACLRTTLVFDRRGGPMCPPGGNIIRFSPIFGEFVMPTMGGHTGPALVGTGFSQPQSMIHLFSPDKPAP